MKLKHSPEALEEAAQYARVYKRIRLAGFVSLAVGVMCANGAVFEREMPKAATGILVVAAIGMILAAVQPGSTPLSKRLLVHTVTYFVSAAISFVGFIYFRHLAPRHIAVELGAFAAFAGLLGLGHAWFYRRVLSAPQAVPTSVMDELREVLGYLDKTGSREDKHIIYVEYHGVHGKAWLMDNAAVFAVGPGAVFAGKQDVSYSPPEEAEGGEGVRVALHVRDKTFRAQLSPESLGLLEEWAASSQVPQ